MKYFSSIIIVLFFTNCVDPKLPAALLITNANIYTVNENFDTAASFVVKDGLILEIGKDAALALKYTLVLILLMLVTGVQTTAV